MTGVSGGDHGDPPVTPFTATGPTTFTSPPRNNNNNNRTSNNSNNNQQNHNNNNYQNNAILAGRPSIASQASQDSTFLSTLNNMSISNKPPTSSSTAAAGTSTPMISATLSTPALAGTSSSQLRLPYNRKTIYDRNLNRSRNAELSRSAFAFLFMEIVAYAHKRVSGIQDFEKRLNEQGYLLGSKCLDLLIYRMTPAGSGSGSSGASGSSQSLSSSSGGGSALALRPLRLLPLLNLLTTRLYPLLFSRPADSLEQSTTEPGEYMIIDNTPLTNTYISVPKEMSQLSVAAYIAGVIEGVCDAAGFEAKVSSHNQGTDLWPNRTVFLLRFADTVLERERELERMGVK